MTWFDNLTYPQAMFLGVAIAATLAIILVFVKTMVTLPHLEKTSSQPLHGELNLKSDPSLDTQLKMNRETAAEVIGVLAASVDELPGEVTEKLRILILAQYSGSLDNTLSALVTHLFTSDDDDHVLCLKKILEYAISREGTDVVLSIRNYGVVMGKYHGIDIRDISKDIEYTSEMTNPVTLLSILIALMSIPQFLHLTKAEGVKISNTKEGTN